MEVWGDGSPKREFIFSDDLAEAIRILLTTSKKKIFKICNNSFPIINVGTRDIYSIKQLVNLIVKKTGYKGKLFFNPKYPNGVHEKDIDITRIKKLNWNPKFDLSSGLDIILREIRI